MSNLRELLQINKTGMEAEFHTKPDVVVFYAHDELWDLLIRSLRQVNIGLCSGI